MKAGNHHSIALQRAARKYGQSAFEFSVLEECAVDQLLVREQHYFDTLKPAYNSCKVAGSSVGLKRTAAQRKANSVSGKKARGTPEWRSAQSARIKKIYAENPWLSKVQGEKNKTRLAAMTKKERSAPYTVEVRQKIGASVKARSTRYDVRGEMLLISEIREQYGVARCTFLGRMQRGWDVERAATEPAVKKHTAGGDRKYSFDGKMMNLTELTQESSCTAAALLRRLKAGLSIDEAVRMTPEQAETRRRRLIVAGMKK